MNAELLEFVVSPSSKVCDKRIKDLDFPRSAIIGGVVRNQVGLIALGDFKIQSGDRVVVCCMPQSIKKVENLFI
jgi:trk system potassium uptake protein TrkA